MTTHLEQWKKNAEFCAQYKELNNEEYSKKLIERPYETIFAIKDNNDGKTITVYSTYDTTHPECPFKLGDNYRIDPSK